MDAQELKQKIYIHSAILLIIFFTLFMMSDIMAAMIFFGINFLFELIVLIQSCNKYFDYKAELSKKENEDS